MCAPCAAALAREGRVAERRSGIVPTTLNSPCSLTKEVLEAWQKALTCVKIKGKGDLIHLPQASMNQMLGILKSALYFPENYCYYKPQLEYFQVNVLPQIITNVPECVN